MVMHRKVHFQNNGGLPIRAILHGLGLMALALCMVKPASAAPVGHWSLDAVNSGTTADWSDNGNDATVAGDASLVAGYHANAMTFDGTDDRLAVSSNAPAFNTTYTAFTAMAWVNPDASTSMNYIMGKMGDVGQRGWQFSMNQDSGYLKFQFFNDAAGSETDSLWLLKGSAFAAEEWMHVAVTFDAATDTIALYTNGVLANTKTSSAMALLNGVNDQNLEIGNRGDNISAGWQGEIDDVKIYGEALSASEIQAEMPLLVPVGHWTFDDVIGSGDTLADITFNHNDATMAGAGFDSAGLMAGKFNNALVFDGVDDHLEVSSNAPAFNSTYTAFTAMAWIKPTAGSGYNYVMGKMGDTGNRGWDIYVKQDTGLIKFTYFNGPSGTADALNFTGLVAADEWMHVAATFEASGTIAIYTNGVLAASDTGALTMLNGVNTANLEIGNRGVGTQFWNGGIDDVRIYAEALTQSEIQSEISSPFGTQLDQVESGAITTARAEWWGVNKAETDATGILQNAIDSNASKILIGAKGSPWFTKPLELRDDLEIVIEEGAVLHAKPGAFHGLGDNLFMAICRTNITIRGPGSLVMNKADYQNPGEYARSEWRHAVNLRACDTVTITNLSISQTGGDGIYVGGKPLNVVKPGWPQQCKNIVIEDCVVDGAHRNGISVITAENLRISNCLVKNTSGTSPEAGIDFEPNLTNEPLINCVVESCTFENNHTYGFLLASQNSDGTTSPYSITVTNCLISSGSRGIVLVKSWYPEKIANPVEGLIEFADCRVEDTEGVGIEFRYFFKEGYQAVFTDCQVTNVATAQPGTSPILMTVYPGVTNKVGNIAFSDTTITDPLARELIQLTPSGESYMRIENVTGTIDYNGSVVDMVEYVADLNTRALVGHWSLDGNADDSANGNNGTLVGDTSYVDGKYNQAATFDGDGDTINIADGAPELDTTFTAFTAMAWIRPNAGSGYNYVMGKMGASGNRGWDIYVKQDTGLIKFTYFKGPSSAEDALSFIGVVAADEWMHVAATFEANGMIAIYTNGVLAASDTGALAVLNGANTADFEIGNRGVGSQYWSGEIDDVKIFAAALTEAEIESIANLIEPAAIVDVVPVSNGVIKMVVNTTLDAESRYFPVAATNLMDGTWINVAHSYTNDLGTLEVTNLTYSSEDATGTNRVIYLQSTEPCKFFRINGE